MSQIEQTYNINAPKSLVWRALVEPEHIIGWGGADEEDDVTMNDAEGTEWELWGGDIWGKNITVISGEKLVQEWYGGEWDKPSIVTFELEEDGAGGTKLTLQHDDLPASEIENFAAGWRDSYLGPLQDYVESLAGEPQDDDSYEPE